MLLTSISHTRVFLFYFFLHLEITSRFEAYLNSFVFPFNHNMDCFCFLLNAFCEELNILVLYIVGYIFSGPLLDGSSFTLWSSISFSSLLGIYSWLMWLTSKHRIELPLVYHWIFSDSFRFLRTASPVAALKYQERGKVTGFFLRNLSTAFLGSDYKIYRKCGLRFTFIFY